MQCRKLTFTWKTDWGGCFQDLELSDVNEILEAHGTELSVQELIDLEGQDESGEDKSDPEGEADQMSIKNIEKLMSKVKEATDIIESIDSNLVRSSTTIAGLLNAIAPYKLMLEEKKKSH